MNGFYGPGYNPALASWAKVHVNGEYLGVYVNVEQRDRRMLENRGLFVRNQTWFYEIDDINGYELEVGNPHSPTYTQLCYAPFQGAGACRTPSDSRLASELPALIDMQAMLTQGAVDALTGTRTLCSRTARTTSSSTSRASGSGCTTRGTSTRCGAARTSTSTGS